MKQNWQKICNQFGPLIWATAFRILKCEDDAVDCYQEVLLHAFEYSQSQKIENWGGYFKLLTTRRAIDLLRKRNRREDYNESIDVANVAAQRNECVDELVEALRHEVAKLPPQQGEAFWLAAVEQRSYAEIAEQINVKTNHVGVLVHRARKQLQQRLKALVLDTSHE